MRKVYAIPIVVVALVALVYLSCGRQGSVGPVAPNSVKVLGSTAEKPHPYGRSEDNGSATNASAKPTTMALALSTGPKVLLLVDANTAGTTALVNAIVAAGYTVTVRPPPEYTWDGTNPPLTDFHCVIHLNGATYWAPLPVAAQTALVNFVQNGGGFIGSQWNGYERATGQQVDMNDLVLQLWPFPDNCGGCTMTWTVVSGQEGHPVLAGIPGSFTFFADGHDAGSQVVFGVNPSTVLMRSPGGGPAVLVRQFGSGRVVNFSHAANYGSGNTLQDPNIQKLYINALAWMCGIIKVIEVDIDIKPGSFPNSINRKNNGNVPVALLSSATFDATTADRSTVQFAGASPLDIGKSPEDVNGDGRLDVVFHFATQSLNLPDSATEACLTGKTTGGQEFEGCDSVRLVK